jgi:hypothetical protein
MDDFQFDATSLEELTADLYESVARFEVETTKTLVEVGEVVKEAAKKIAEEDGSSSIPPTVKSRAAPGLVAVSVGSKEVPLGALWDLGNTGRGGRKKDDFWHPVWGHRVPGALQKRHPILKRARTLSRKAINGLMNETYDRVLEPLGHRGGKE